MPVKSWFPTHVYEAPLQGRGNADFTRLLREECHRLREQDVEGQSWSKDNYPAGYTSYGTQRNLHRVVPTFVRLEAKIWRHVERFAHRLDMDLREADLAMTDCWVNIMSRDASHAVHDHPGAVVSGTFYVTTPTGCSTLHFEDPRLAHFVGVPPRRADCRPDNRQRVAHDVEAGKLILFESWLRHGVAPNPTTDERISISFNYTWV